MSNGTVTIAFTIGFGNNLFQYVYGRLLAEKNNLGLVHRAIPEVGIKARDDRDDARNTKMPTVAVTDKNYKRVLFTDTLSNCNVLVNGYFEDYKILENNLTEIRSWFDKVPITNTEDVILHLRLQNRLVQEAHNKNHISAEAITSLLQKMDYNRLHIVTDAERWDTHTSADIKKVQDQIRRGPNPNPAWVSTEQSLEYINHLIDGLSKLDPITHCNGAEMMPGTGGLRGSFIDDFNLIRSFDKVIIHNSTFSWWAAALSGASNVAIFNPWKIAKPAHQRRNLGETSFPGWFCWGGAEALYFKKYGITL